MPCPGRFTAKPSQNRIIDLVQKSLFFNRLDHILRQAQDGQTIGIPVGPDSSRIIAEIVATAVDADFVMQIKQTPALVRHVDDIWIGARNQDDAENFLYIYRACLREYELDINELKTSIIPATRDISHFWPKELGDLLRDQFAVAFGFPHPRNHEIIFVLDRVFDLANQHKDDGIIKFAIRRLDLVRAWSHHWEVLEPFMMRCVVNYPHSVDYVARVLAWRTRIGRDINLARWQPLLNEFIGFHARLRNDSEVCWALWLARELGTKVRRHVAELVISDCGPMALTLLCDCIERRTVQSRLDRERIRAAL